MKRIFTLAIMALFCATATVAESPGKPRSRAKKIEAFNLTNQAKAQSDAPMWRPRTVTSYWYDNNQPIVDIKWTITYDNFGRVLSYRKIYSEDEFNEYTVEYNDLGYIIKEVYSEEPGRESVSIYTYDSVDPTKVTEIWDGYYIDGVLSGTPEEYKFEYIRDSQNRVVKVNNYNCWYKDSGNLTLYTTFEITYNDKGEPITQKLFRGGELEETLNMEWETFSGYFYGTDDYRELLLGSTRHELSSLNETQRLKQLTQIDETMVSDGINGVETTKAEFTYTQNSVIQTLTELDRDDTITTVTEVIYLEENKFIVYDTQIRNYEFSEYTTKSVNRYELSQYGHPLDVYYLEPGESWGEYDYRFELSHISASESFMTGNAHYDFNTRSYKGIEILDPEHGYLLEFKTQYSDDQFMAEGPDDWTIFETIEPDVTYSDPRTKYTFGDYINLNTSSDVDLPEIDNSNLPVEYFTIDGYKIENPENGFFIRRQGTDVKKILLR